MIRKSEEWIKHIGHSTLQLSHLSSNPTTRDVVSGHVPRSPSYCTQHTYVGARALSTLLLRNPQNNRIILNSDYFFVDEDSLLIQAS